MHAQVGTSPRWRSLAGWGGLVGLALLGWMAYGPATQTAASIAPGKSSQAVAPEPAPSGGGAAVVLASPGRIEGSSDEVEVGAGMDGVIAAIRVKEGQHVRRGSVVAELDCRELQASLPLARSEAESLRQVRSRLQRGSRQEEREAAAQRTARAKTVVEHARVQLDRQRSLFDEKIVSRSSVDDLARDAAVAESEYQLAIRNEALINADPLREEIAKADADVESAEKRIAQAEEKLGKCVVTAPIDGTVLRVHLHPAESFALVAPRPILSMADISGRRVRAEVDEHDVGKIHNGQPVVITSEAFAGRTFAGTVTKVASVMGRKSVLTGDPADKNDRDVLEVTAQLEAAANALPVGLRATVHFQK